VRRTTVNEENVDSKSTKRAMLSLLNKGRETIKESFQWCKEVRICGQKYPIIFMTWTSHYNPA